MGVTLRRARRLMAWPVTSIRRSSSLLRRVYEFRRRLLRACPRNVRFDLVLCHDDLPAIAAAALAARTGARLALDIVEIHRLRERTGEAYRLAPRWVTRHLDRIHLDIMRRADVRFTIGTGLAEVIAADAGEATIVRNARPYIEPPARSNAMRRDLGLSEGAFVIVSVGGISQGMGLESIAAGLPRIGRDAHLVHVGSIGETAREVLIASGSEGHVHFAPAQDWNELPGYLADADIGVVPWRPSPSTPLNLQLAFPNRVFDFIAARLPIVAYSLPDIVALMQAYRLGEIAGDDIVETLTIMADNLESYRPGVERAAREVIAQREMERLCAAIGGARRIALVCMKDPAAHARLQRILAALVHAGKDVTVFSAKAPKPMPGVRWSRLV